jgi:hypothetical protein
VAGAGDAPVATGAPPEGHTPLVPDAAMIALGGVAASTTMAPRPEPGPTAEGADRAPQPATLAAAVRERPASTATPTAAPRSSGEPSSAAPAATGVPGFDAAVGHAGDAATLAPAPHDADRPGPASAAAPARERSGDGLASPPHAPSVQPSVQRMAGAGDAREAAGPAPSARANEPDPFAARRMADGAPGAPAVTSREVHDPASAPQASGVASPRRAAVGAPVSAATGGGERIDATRPATADAAPAAPGQPAPRPASVDVPVADPAARLVTPPPDPRAAAPGSRDARGTESRTSGRRGERSVTGAAFVLDPAANVAAAARPDATLPGARPHDDSPMPEAPEWAASGRKGRDDGVVDDAVRGVEPLPRPSLDAPVGPRSADGPEAAQGHDGERRPPLTPRVVVDQVVAHTARLEGDGRHAVHVRLEPPDLGAVRIDAVLDGRDLTLTIRTERESARELLADGLGELREALVDHGLVPDRVSVELDVAGGGYQAPDRGGAPFAHEAPPWAPRRAAERPSAPTVRSTRDAVGVDLLV